MTLTKPEDSAAKAIRFGVEIETTLPATCGFEVGGYHRGYAIERGMTPAGVVIAAPKFAGQPWKSERDSSIRVEPGQQPCEFVSPILGDEDGVAKLREMVRFIRAIGGKVNDSCGLHITVGIASIIGTSEVQAVTDYCRKLAHIAQANAWAIYAQTGTGRHANHYSAALRENTGDLMLQLTRTTDNIRLQTVTQACGRGMMVNFTKVFTAGVIEFRAFAGTLNEKKIMHHLATVLGICRRAATVQIIGRFNRKASKKHSCIKSATDAVRRMWRLLGWVDSVPSRECALGLFGSLYSEFGSYRKTALEMAEQFETRYPSANL